MVITAVAPTPSLSTTVRVHHIQSEGKRYWYWETSYSLTEVIRGVHFLCLGCTWWRFTTRWDWVSRTSTTYLFHEDGMFPGMHKSQKLMLHYNWNTNSFCIGSNQRLPAPCLRLQPCVSCCAVNQIITQSEIQSVKSATLIPDLALDSRNPRGKVSSRQLWEIPQ